MDRIHRAVFAGLAAFAATVGRCLPGLFMRTSADRPTWSDPAKIPLAEPEEMLRNPAVVRLAGECGTLHRVDPDVGEVAPGRVPDVLRGSGRGSRTVQPEEREADGEVARNNRQP